MEPAAEDRSGGERRDGSVVVLLSLYLLLLAFFIMLTALSQRELSRAEAAVGSVVKVFKPDLAEETLDKATEGPAGLFRARGAFESEVQAVFADTLPVARFEADGAGNVLRAEVPVENLFRPGSTALYGSSERLLGGLAGALSRLEPGQDYRLEVVLRSGPELPGGERLGEVLELRRAAALAGALRAQGAPARLISVGVRPGDPGLVQFGFHDEAVPDRTAAVDGND